MKPINIRNTCINSCHIDIIQDVNTNDITTPLNVDGMNLVQSLA